MNYILMPLDAHSDSGFGAIAEAFREAAMALREAVPNPAFFAHLPQSFLFRHSVELFLKSEIVILHRKLKLPYGEVPHDGQPMVLADGKWKSLFQVHSIEVLYHYWRSLIDPRLKELREITKYDVPWDVVEGADGWVQVIEAIDPRSTYSRYPSMRDPAEDQSKSPFKRASREDLFPPGDPKERSVMALVVEDENGEFIRAYASDKGEVQDEEYISALEQMCEMLFNYHAMMRIELTAGF